MFGTHTGLSVLLLDDQGQHSHTVATCLGQIHRCVLHVLSNIRWPAVRFSRFVASFHRFHSNDEAACLKDIRRVSCAVHADVLLPVTESGVRFAARNRAALADDICLPPLPSPELFETVTNKFSLSRYLEQQGFPTPSTFLFSSIAKAKTHLNRLSFPVLLKPVSGSGGSGISRFDTPAELLANLHARPLAPGSNILQSCIPGNNVDCSVLCRDGKILAHTMQVGLRPRKNPFVPDNAMYFAPHTSAFAVVEKVVAALRWNGLAHLDTVEDKRDGCIYIIDFNPRFWLTLLGSLTAGVNFPHLACLAALGIKFSPPSFRSLEYLTAPAALKALATGQLGHCKTGLLYLWDDPGPRALNFFKRLAQR